MNASKAYALGFTGKDVAVGVMDPVRSFRIIPILRATASTQLR